VSAALRLTDADGHIIEDELAIASRLSEGYRKVRIGRLDQGGTSLLGSVFPSLGFLSNMPTTGPGMIDFDSGTRLAGDTPESWQVFLDAVGIEKTVLYPSGGLALGRVRDLGYAVDVARAYNDWIAETYVAHPSGKFQAAAVLPLQVPEAAVTELERAVEELGLCSAVLPSHGLVDHLGAPQYWPVYEAAAALDVGLACHGGVHDGLGMDGLNMMAPVHALGHPVGLLISLAGLVFNGVFDRFPRLRMALLEGGSAWLLLAAERFSESYSAIHPAQESEWTFRLRDHRRVRDYLTELLQSGRLVSGCEGGEDFLEVAVDYFDCSPFMYSSDFPHEVDVESCKHELEELAELKIPDEARAEICGGTARRFYKI
jgi:predicted TIM-barrel fold metal-dependent hydrolase